MASTTRKQVFAGKKGVKENSPEEFPTVLSQEHLKQLEITIRDIENAKLTVAIEEQSLRNMMLEQQLLEQKVQKQKQTLQQRAVFYDTISSQFKQIKSELWPQYGFSQTEGLGYDPATGEIKRT